MYVTCTDGFFIKSIKNISANDFYLLCHKLEYRFNHHFNTTDFKFVPESISEGGILFENFPNKKNNMYKSMRIFIETLTDDHWPAIHSNILNEWENNNNKIISNKRKIRTFLKAYEGTPPWTIEELQIFEECFKEIGLLKVGKYPKLLS